jgi:CRISPR-associated DxTHG motif protein
MRKVITFLGIYPKTTEYLYQSQVYVGQVFPEALYQFLDFDEMLVFVTESAYLNSFPVLNGLQDERIKPVKIPTGENSDEMWKTFEAITEVVDENDTVIFDITHSLRSIPFLIFLAAAFLKSAKNVEIEGIYYGAFELQKDAQGNSRPAPVIELSEFVNLIDWLGASNYFVNSGNATALTQQLRKMRPGSDLQRTDRDIRNHSIEISKAANALDNVSRSLRLILPDQAMEASENLQATLGSATAAIEQWARPFAIIAQQVSDAYAPLALANPRHPTNLTSSLNRERQMVQWYLSRNLLVQAVALAREWLVTWGMLQVGYDNTYDLSRREAVEKVFGKANKQRMEQRGSFDDHIFETEVRLHTVSFISNALDLYRNLGDVRNTLLHAGKRPITQSAEDLEKQVRKLCQQLNELPLPDIQETP